ncbi:MAG: peptidoglycan-binding protein [Pelatocladus maniniholoensis HA4357-MV3]|jgi:peptidoglycan hydrolase-like protein with peptidoglycan-binding domain|uniref:Peptidoglycan-binding protein n=1 Tax=Pelatocladus maniniholoensis HA4357-MV3 TaxID=1117104 RepID=A0A9E3HB42_9NOST|nr:peptidoglycan-binding protein [Pelatocladus maniniholoensis HA4357-MV3]BAZ65895.1 hypothetical protein NIES4106_06400 [Fischerella sp. NIES-4106]
MEFISYTGDSIPITTQSELKKPELQLGSYGEAVVELQNLLIKSGLYTDKIDGIFAKMTQESVKAFQRQVFLQEDGIVTEETWQALYKGEPVNLPELKQGSQGELVMKVQRVLKSTQDYVGYVDGEFGPVTESALQSWQMRNNLPDTGIIDEVTWCTLSQIPQ